MATETELLLRMANDPEYGQATRDYLERSTNMRNEVARRSDFLARADEAARQRRISPTSLHRPLPGEEVKYEAPGILMDPGSWLNRGLSNLAGNTLSVIFGEESGNPAVDYGLSNIPGVGAAGILAAGGVPGMVDVAGAGALKNAAKIPKYTMEFVLKHFGERGLRNLDNALTKYPKAGKPSVNDAVYLMKSGLGGEQVPAIVPYSTSNALNDIDDAFDKPRGNINETTHDLYKQLSSDLPQHRKLLDDALRLFETGVEENDVKKIMSGYAVIANIDSYRDHPDLERRLRSYLADHRDFGYTIQMEKVKADSPEKYEQVRRVKELADSPVQDWGSIVKKQEVKDARDAEKLARKASKQAATPQQAAVAKQAEIEAAETKEAVQETPVQEIVPEPAEKWAGWNEGNPKFYENFGENLDRNSRRDMFVMDSLANHWANQLNPQKGFSAARILSGLDRADARHSLTNYDQVSRGFSNDVLRNLESGNMPGQSVQILQRFKRNRAVPGKTVPTMVLRLDEKPKVFLNPNVWADEAEGPDLYELLFRPRIDRKLHEANPAYWER